MTETRTHVATAQFPPELSLVMPCFNEEACLRQTVTALIATFHARNIRIQLILVDNGSHDRTGAIIDELRTSGMPVTKAVVAVNRGYGYGILQGLEQATAPLVGFLCADGQVPPDAAVAAFALAHCAERPTLVKVRRRFRKDSWRRKLVSVAYNIGMQFIFGWLDSIDLNGNPKVLPRDVLLSMRLQSHDWFLDPEIMIKAKYMGLKVIECQVEGKLRQGGQSNVRLSTCLEFLKNIARYRLGSPIRRWRSSADPEVSRDESSVAAAVGR
jgi:glycosyltransferase involved in cell wall biosynthesis